MTRLIFSSLFIFLLFISFCLSQPRLEIIGGGTYDWGEVKPKDSPLKANIKLTNIGNKKLKIKNVKTSCGCTTAPLDKKELKPGDTTVMRVKLNVGSRKGNVQKSITITSNDPKQGRKILFIKANVSVELELSPTSYLTFQDMKVGYEKTAKITLNNNSKKDVVISNVEYSPESLWINLKGEKVIKSGGELEIVAKAKPEKEGYYNCNIKFKTTHPDYPEFNIRGYGKVKKSPLFNE